MSLVKYLERRDFQIIIIVGFLISLLLIQQYGPFLAYGVPGITFHEVSQTKPAPKTVTILGSYGEWVAFEYYREIKAEWKNLLGQVRYSIVSLSVRINIKVETSDLALSGFLTEIKPPPWLINETLTEYIFRNMTVQAYAYGFKLNVAWSGTAQVSVVKDYSDILITGGPTYQELHKEAVQRLVADFNKHYLTSAKILLSIDAPTLARDQAYKLRPDYLGIAGMWLADYVVEGYTPGTAAELLPQSKGTAVKLYRDKDLRYPCWAADYDKDFGKPLLTPDVVYWLDHYAPYSAWWSISIVNLGSQLVYDETRADPNYICWAWEKYGGKTAPCVAQWFRVDLLFKTTKDWKAPKIPDYELPEEVKEKMQIVIMREPINQAPPITPPPVTPPIPWREIIYILLTIFGGLTVIIIVYNVSKRKIGGVK
ncbi:MAG: hypothetical protein NZ932_04030 [Candidatus Bathyarchaeota archaeon]|nr:hypothetical protein [Candidatus Bathyarchaeota archaeon]MDW8022362.1 hypothetical protein [Nitrososphaerota archaeon]